ncbi:MAG: hypothetical protein Q9194_007727, partial [Teloschistes cf. exilis]
EGTKTASDPPREGDELVDSYAIPGPKVSMRELTTNQGKETPWEEVSAQEFFDVEGNKENISPHPGNRINGHWDEDWRDQPREEISLEYIQQLTMDSPPREDKSFHFQIGKPSFACTPCKRLRRKCQPAIGKQVCQRCNKFGAKQYDLDQAV